MQDLGSSRAMLEIQYENEVFVMNTRRHYTSTTNRRTKQTFIKIKSFMTLMSILVSGGNGSRPNARVLRSGVSGVAKG